MTIVKTGGTEAVDAHASIPAFGGSFAAVKTIWEK